MRFCLFVAILSLAVAPFAIAPLCFSALCGCTPRDEATTATTEQPGNRSEPAANPPWAANAFRWDETKQIIYLDTRIAPPQRRRFDIGLGSITVETLHVTDHKPTFRYAPEIEGGYTTYECTIPVLPTPVEFKITPHRTPGATSFDLAGCKVIFQGNLPSNPNDGRVSAADSPGMQLTRENVDKQPLLFHIAATNADNRIRFCVTVKAQKGTAQPKLAVWLNVFEDKTPIVSCLVAGEQARNAISYEFLVARKYLDASLLHIGGGPKEDVPEGGNYFFVLKDFASSTDVDGDK